MHVLGNSSTQSLSLVLRFKNLTYCRFRNPPFTNSKLSPSNYLRNPSPYTREVQHYKDSNDDLIRRTITQFNCKSAFENKNMDEKVLTFNKIVWNILCNFILYEIIVCDDKDPLCFHTKIKSLIHEKIKTYKILRKSIENNQQIEKLKSMQNRLKCTIDDSKHNYYLRLANKLLNVQRKSNPYWSILKHN